MNGCMRFALAAVALAGLSGCVATGQGTGGQAAGPQGLNLFASQQGTPGPQAAGNRIGSVGQVGIAMAKLGFSQDRADEAVRALEKGFADVKAGRGSPNGNRLCNDSKSPASVSVPIQGGKVAVCRVAGSENVVQFAVYGADRKGRQGKRLIGDVSNSGGGWQLSELRNP